MSECETKVLKACAAVDAKVYAWCILPNHYHLLVLTDRIDELRAELGKFHGKSSFEWNGEENKRGRKVWFRSVERPMKSERHFWTSMNYIHHNPVKHGYVEKWTDWPIQARMNFWKVLAAKRHFGFGTNTLYWITARNGMLTDVESYAFRSKRRVQSYAFRRGDFRNHA